MLKKIGLQLHTIKSFLQTEEDVRESFQKIRKYGYTQVQTIPCGIPCGLLGKIAEEEGIEIVGTHNSFDTLLKNTEKIIEENQQLGSRNVGIGSYNRYESLDDVKRFIEQANQIGDKVAVHGMKFTYHNHSQEFIKWENGKTTMDMLVEGLNPRTTSFVLDTYWVQFGGADVRYWIEKLAGRIDILHLKDMKLILASDCGKVRKVQQYAEIGAGNLNWELILQSAGKSGVQYYIVEQDNYFRINCFASVKESAEYLHQFIQ